MAERTSIEWTDATVNFWWGCTKVGPGCDHCYAETWAKRTGGNLWGHGVPRRKIKGAVKLLYKLHNGYSWWAADHAIGNLHATSHRRVFIQSMSDLFDKEVPQEWFDEAWGAITACDKLAIQIVTKRISLIEKRLDGRPWPKHAGLIISIVNQEEADRDIPRLLDLKARLGIPWVGLSMEPLLGAVILRPEWLELLDWIIVGGESGSKARPMHPDWARSLRDQCEAASVAFHFKQWGSWLPWEPEHGPCWKAQNGRSEDHHALFPADMDHDPNWDDGLWATEEWDHFAFQRVGKKRAGRLLDGVTHDGIPA